MSAGGSYLNSSVSLISKASIRYEGTLYSINPQEATITLSNVRSYGTEDRKVDKYLAPKDTFFEYIIFKANDIKELIVDEPLNDPAIVTAQMPGSNTSNNAYPAFNSDNQQNNLPLNGLSSDAQATLNGISNNANQATSAPSISSAGQAGDRFRSRGSTPSSNARSPVSELSSNTRQKSDLQKIMSRGQNDQRNVRNNNQQPNQQQRRGWDNNRVNNYGNQNNQNNRRQGNYIGNNMNNNRRYQGYQNNYPNNQFNRPGFHTRRNDDRISNHLNNNRNNLNRTNHPLNNNRNMRGGRKFVPNSNKKFDATLKTEFDFEKANQVFQQMVDKLEDLNISANGDKAEKSGSEDKDETTKADIEKSTDKVDEEGNFYDKTKSFFDNISCEAIERTKGVQKRFDWKLERKLNAETFGFKVGFRPNVFFRQPFINHNRTNPNRRFNNGHNQLQQRNAPRNNSS